MASAEFEIPTFEPSPEAQRDAAIMEAMAVPAEERWAHLGQDDPTLARQLLILRSQLEAEGASPVDREMALITFVNEVHRSRASKIAAVPETTELHAGRSTPIIDDLERKRTRRWRPWRVGAALLLMMRKGRGDNLDDSIF